MNDLKFAFRQLWKNPGFTAVAVLSLALGIGSCVAAFRLIDGHPQLLDFISILDLAKIFDQATQWDEF